MREILLKADAVIEKRIRALLDKYENEPETKSEILSELGMYQINRSIALDLNDNGSVYRLTREFNHYLNKFNF